MSFISALPRPFIYEESREESDFSLREENEAVTQESMKFLIYDVTSENLRLLCRDLSRPFEYLKYFASTRPIDLVDSDPDASICSSKILEKKAKIIEIKLKILHRTEKGQSLSNIPALIGRSLEGINFNFFLEIMPTFMEVIICWVECVKKRQQRKKRNCFYATPRTKFFDVEKLTKELEKIFNEAFNFYNRPNFADLTYYQFQEFLDYHSIPYSGPYKNCFNGKNLVSIFVIGNVNCLRFFNDNSPLFGIFEFEPTAQIENYENLPKWFLDPPTINNFAINKMIADFERLSFI